MAPFVLLALALAVMAAGAALVAGHQLLRVARRLRAAATRITQQVRPLLDELGDEVSVVTAETEALQERIAAFSRDRERRSRGLPPASAAPPPVAPTGIPYTGV